MAHLFQCEQTDLAHAKESGERKEKMVERRSKGRLLHMLGIVVKGSCHKVQWTLYTY